VAYCVIYTTKVYDIPISLVINSDQIGIHLAPTLRECTWKNKGSKHIHVLGIKDKRYVNVVVSSFVAKILLPLQVIFTCIT